MMLSCWIIRERISQRSGRTLRRATAGKARASAGGAKAEPFHVEEVLLTLLDVLSSRENVSLTVGLYGPAVMIRLTT